MRNKEIEFRACDHRVLAECVLVRQVIAHYGLQGYLIAFLRQAFEGFLQSFGDQWRVWRRRRSTKIRPNFTLKSKIFVPGHML